MKDQISNVENTDNVKGIKFFKETLLGKLPIGMALMVFVLGQLTDLSNEEAVLMEERIRLSSEVHLNDRTIKRGTYMEESFLYGSERVSELNSFKINGKYLIVKSQFLIDSINRCKKDIVFFRFNHSAMDDRIKTNSKLLLVTMQNYQNLLYDLRKNGNVFKKENLIIPISAIDKSLISDLEYEFKAGITMLESLDEILKNDSLFLNANMKILELKETRRDLLSKFYLVLFIYIIIVSVFDVIVRTYLTLKYND